MRHLSILCSMYELLYIYSKDSYTNLNYAEGKNTHRVSLSINLYVDMHRCLVFDAA